MSDTTAAKDRPWLIPLMGLIVTAMLQFGAVVWFARGLQSGLDEQGRLHIDLVRRVAIIEATHPGMNDAAVEKRLAELEAGAKDLRLGIGSIGDKIGLSNEKLARIEGQLAFILERSQRQGTSK